MRTLGSALFASMLAAAAFAASCGPAAGGENGALEDGSNATVAAQLALGIAEAMIDLQAPLDGSMGADANAMTVETRATASLGGCGTISRTGATLTVDYGTGCALPGGVMVSGAISIGIAVTSSTATVTIEYIDVVANGTPIDGTLALTASPPSYTVALDLMSGTRAVSGMVTVTATASSLTFDGSLTVVSGATITLDAASIVWVTGDCWPSAGSLTITALGIAQTVTFSAATANRGTVTVTRGRMTSTEQLPAYGMCPVPLP
jgi:hypothetical protein